MRHTEIIKAVMKDTNTRQIDLVERLGTKTQSVISGRINHANISVIALAELLEAMGHEIMIVPKSDEGRAVGEYVIRLEDYQE